MSLIFRTLDKILERNTPAAPDRVVSADMRWRHLRHYGDFPLAYPCATERYLSTFGDDRGLISYAQKMGITYALGDPVAQGDAQSALLDEFIGAFGRPVFVACQRQTAEKLSALGYSVNEFGYDSVIDLEGHSFAGGAYKRVRYGTNWLESHGMSISEDLDGSTPKKAIKRLSGRWRKTRVTRREIRFLNREFSPQIEPDVRRFIARYEDGGLAGLLNFDPVYSQGRITGYLASQKRRLPKDSAYLDLAMLRHAIDTFQAEGLQSVFLGITPIADIEPSGFDRELGWLRRGLQAAHGSDWVNSRIFNSRGLAEAKNRFRGRRVPLYLCLPGRGSNMLRAIGLLRLLRLV
ncbi:MAG: phosphatidylglycerol lysyltransferase domain-containing protein [Silicimonas sp.]|nr:phosphatidylglycerol lysyltransferase domain-containing protein [Silicimonas sp.]